MRYRRADEPKRKAGRPKIERTGMTVLARRSTKVTLVGHAPVAKRRALEDVDLVTWDEV